MTWPPKSTHPDALASMYNRAYEIASCERGDSAEEAHQVACEAVHREGFFHATGGRVEHPALIELREAAREVLFEFPDEGNEDDPNWVVTQERRDRLQAALNYLAQVQGRGEGPVADLRSPLWGKGHTLRHDLEALVRDQLPTRFSEGQRPWELPQDLSDPMKLVQWLIDTVKAMREPIAPAHRGVGHARGTIIHTQAEKEWLKREIRKYGPDAVLSQQGLTLEDALQLVDDCPTEFVPIGDSCDNRDERGVCRGHRQPEQPFVSFVTDDEPESEDAVRMHILAADDYWISVSRGERPPMDAFRACTSGARDYRVTFLIAALYKLGRADLEGACRAAIAFVEDIEQGRVPRWDQLTRECLTMVLGWFSAAIGDSEVSEKVEVGLAWGQAVAERDAARVELLRGRWNEMLEDERDPS